jgi:hypothetical protein
MSARCLALLFLLSSHALNVRAEVMLGFRTVNSPPLYPTDPISNFYTLANTSAINGPLSLTVGEMKYIAVTLRATPTNVGPEQAFWNSSSSGSPNLLTNFGMNLTYNPAVVDNPYVPYVMGQATLTENYSNLRIQSANSGFVVAYPNQPYPPGYRQIVGLTLGGLPLDGSYSLPETPIAVLKLVGVGSGDMNLNLSHLTLGPNGNFANFWGVTDGLTSHLLDNEVFLGTNNTYSLQIHVTSVPEPTSLCLITVAFTIVGWRVRRLSTTHILA